MSIGQGISVGVSTLKAGDSMTSLFDRADKALYLSQKGGSKQGQCVLVANFQYPNFHFHVMPTNNGRCVYFLRFCTVPSH